MPIKIDNQLPARHNLELENIFVMTEQRASIQDIRPLKIILLNLMPTKIETETQILRLLSNSPLQVEIELLQVATHESKNTSKEHMLKFYKTFDDIKDQKFDGMIVTGAPVEMMPFEEVDYWEELCRILSGQRVMFIRHSTFAGVHRRHFITTTEFQNTSYLKRCLVFSHTSPSICIIRFFVVSVICSMCHIPVTQKQKKRI